jgi:putative ABC transport system permease protein
VTSQVQAVSPGYFAAVGVPLLTGRGFAAQDDEHGAPVAIVNRWAASHWWPNESAIGQIIRLGGSDGAASPLTIIGVVADNKASRPNLLLAEDGPELYRPYRQTPSPFPSFLVRSSSQPLTLLRPVRSVLTRLVPDRPLFAAPVSETAGRQLGGVRTNALQIAGFALVGLLLAVIGVYSVLAFETSRRTREIGIRGALGATGGRIARMVLGEASRLAVLGVLAGLPAAAVSTSLIRSLLYSTDPRDPLVYAAVVVTVLVVSLLAAYVPARRAARVSPIIAIRAD